MILRLNIFNFLFLILVIPISLLFEGIRRKLIARMQNRIGPSIWQIFYDVIKLLESGNSLKKNGNIIFQMVYLITSFMLFLFVPYPIISFSYDFIFLICILILNGAIYILLGILSNTFYGKIISIKEIAIMLCYNAIIGITIFTFTKFSGIQSLAEFNESFVILKLPIASICLFIAILASNGISSFDTSNTYKEVLGNIDTESYGKNLAIFKISSSLKLTFFIFLIALLCFGFKDIIKLSITSLFMMFIISFIQTISCGYRLNQILKILILVMIFGIIELIRIQFSAW